MHSNEFEGEHFEKLNLKSGQYIYNPIFDEFRPFHYLFLDFEQYLSIKRCLQMQMENEKLNNNLNSLLYSKNDTQSSTSFQFQTQLSPFYYENQIKLPKIKIKKQIKLTPFQQIQKLASLSKNNIYAKKKSYSHTNLDLVLENKNSKSQQKDNQLTKIDEEEKRLKFKMKNIGSYISFINNKRELEKVEKVRGRNSSLKQSRNLSNPKFALNNPLIIDSTRNKSNQKLFNNTIYGLRKIKMKSINTTYNK